MIFKNIVVIEHDFFIGDAIFNNEPDFAMFRYNHKRQIYEPRGID